MENTDHEREIQQLHEELGRRQFRRRGPQKMAESLSQLMSRRGYAQQQTASALADLWRQAVGGRLAEHCRVGNLRRGVLEVFVRNSAVVQELSFEKKQVLTRLGQLNPDFAIRDVRFRVGEIS